MKWMIPIVVMLALAPAAWGQMFVEDFERWDTVDTRIKPPGWWLQYPYLARTEDAHSGRYAAQIMTWYGSVPGYMGTGEEGSNPWTVSPTAAPISYKPSRLTGYYRYLLGDNYGRNDSAVVTVLLQRYDSATQTSDTIGYAEKRLGPAATYIPFSVEIIDRAPGIDPTSMMITFISSLDAACGTEGKCCTLSIDDIQLSPTSSVGYGAAPLFENARVYPTPMHASARVEWDAKPGCEYALLLYSMSGELLSTIEPIVGGAATLDRAGLPSGEYLFEIRDRASGVVAQGRMIAE